MQQLSIFICFLGFIFLYTLLLVILIKKVVYYRKKLRIQKSRISILKLEKLELVKYYSKKKAN